MSYIVELRCQPYIVELPCEPGTKVWYLDKTRLKVLDCQVTLITAEWPKNCKAPTITLKVSGVTENYIVDCSPQNLSKILFFTQVEADTALEALQKELQGKHCDTCASLGAHYNRLVKGQILCYRCHLHSKVLDDPANQVCGEYQKREETK